MKTFAVVAFCILFSSSSGLAAPRGGGFRGGSVGLGGRGFGGGIGYRGGTARGFYGTGYYGGYRGYGYGFGYRRFSYPYFGLGLGYFPYLGFSSFYSPYGYSSYPYGYAYPSLYDYVSPAVYPAYSSDNRAASTSSLSPAPVVVNQYYSQPVRERQEPPPGRDSSGHLSSSVNAGSSALYLIAFPDGSVQIAVAYWVDGTTLHYVTREKAQKQINISGIDKPLTEQLNRDRHIDFRLP